MGWCRLVGQLDGSGFRDEAQKLRFIALFTGFRIDIRRGNEKFENHPQNS